MPYKSRYFTFNGKSSRDYQLRLCRVGTSSSNPLFGLQRSIEKENTHYYATSIKAIDHSDVTLELTLIKTDGNLPLPISEDEKVEIISWLFQDSFKPLIFDSDESKIYYAILTAGNSYQNGLKQGYFNLTLQLNAPCAFSPIQTGYFRVEGLRELELMNRSNVGTYVEPDIEFKLMDGATSFSIKNLNTGDCLSFENLPEGSHIRCYNEGMKQMICIDNPSLNVRKYLEDKKWIRLAKGKNRLVIETPLAEVTIVGQARLALS